MHKYIILHVGINMYLNTIIVIDAARLQNNLDALVDIYIYMQIYMCMCIYVSIDICIDRYMKGYIYTYVLTDIHMYIYICARI